MSQPKTISCLSDELVRAKDKTDRERFALDLVRANDAADVQALRSAVVRFSEALREEQQVRDLYAAEVGARYGSNFGRFAAHFVAGCDPQAAADAVNGKGTVA